MKTLKIFSMLFVIFSLCIFSSCKNQDEPVIKNNVKEVALKAQLAKIQAPSKEEMLKFLSGSVQKVKSDEGQQITLVEIFALDSTTYQIVGDDLAIRYFIYYEIDATGNRKKMLTIGQYFNIKDGKIDETNYSFNVAIGCNFARSFYFESSGNVQQITYFFRFNNGNQFAYYSNSGSNEVKLPPIADGKWQLKVDFYDGDLFQSYMSEMIDLNGYSNVIQLKFEIKEQNVLSLVFLNKSYIQNAYLIQFIGKDENNNFVAVSYPTKYDESLPDRISFNTPIKVLTRVVICSADYGCIYYNLIVSANSPIDGTKIYYDLVSN